MLTGHSREIGNFTFRDTEIPGVLLVDVRCYPDDTGFLYGNLQKLAILPKQGLTACLSRTINRQARRAS